ncbi:MAG: hypothetical protein K6E10_05650 [Eubacterium sp.]|nr:hypothetical protein [Eubacterium sp.]
MTISSEVSAILEAAAVRAGKNKYEYITPEGILLEMTFNKTFYQAFENCGGSVQELGEKLTSYMEENIDKVEKPPQLSAFAEYIFIYAETQAENSGCKEIKMRHMLKALWELDDCYATYYMEEQDVNEVDLFREIADLEDIENIEDIEDIEQEDIQEESGLIDDMDYGKDHRNKSGDWPGESGKIEIKKLNGSFLPLALMRVFRM